MNKAAIIKEFSAVTIKLLITVALMTTLLLIASAALYSLKDQSKYVRKDCTDYSSSQYKAVEADYKSGNTHLDGRGKDGIPCNYLNK